MLGDRSASERSGLSCREVNECALSPREYATRIRLRFGSAESLSDPSDDWEADLAVRADSCDARCEAGCDDCSSDRESCDSDIEDRTSHSGDERTLPLPLRFRAPCLGEANGDFGDFGDFGEANTGCFGDGFGDCFGERFGDHFGDRCGAAGDQPLGPSEGGGRGESDRERPRDPAAAAARFPYVALVLPRAGPAESLKMPRVGDRPRASLAGLALSLLRLYVTLVRPRVAALGEEDRARAGDRGDHAGDRGVVLARGDGDGDRLRATDSRVGDPVAPCGDDHAWAAAAGSSASSSKSNTLMLPLELDERAPWAELMALSLRTQSSWAGPTAPRKI